MNLLENTMNKGERMVQLLENFDLFWNVNKVSLSTPDGDDSGFYGTQREDTKEVFTTVKEGYQVLQNWELAEMITEVAGQFDMEVARGGHFKGGARVYLQIATGDLKGIGENNDTVKKYLTAINSHDGSSSVAFGLTNVTVSCDNVFHQVTRQAGIEKIRHSVSMRENIDTMMREFEAMKVAEQTLYEKFMTMANRPMTTNDIMKTIRVVTGVDASVRAADAEDLYSKYQLAETQKLSDRIKEETSYKGETLWGLFSGVTSYTSKDKRVPNRENARLESKYTGGAYKVDNKVFHSLNV